MEDPPFPLTLQIIGDLGKLLQLFGQYRLCSGAYHLGVHGHISLAVGGKPSCIQRKSQVKVFKGILCWTVLRQVLTEERHLTKIYQTLQDEISLI